MRNFKDILKEDDLIGDVADDVVTDRSTDSIEKQAKKYMMLYARKIGCPIARAATLTEATFELFEVLAETKFNSNIQSKFLYVKNMLYGKIKSMLPGEND